MRPRASKYPEDIREAAAFISSAVAVESLDTYRANRLLRQTVERNFEIIGTSLRIS